MPTEKRNIHTAKVAGREVPVYEATPTQIAFIGRFTKRAAKALEVDDVQAAMYSIGDVLDILDSLVVNPADRDELSKLMITGALEADEFINAWSEAMPAPAPATGPTSKVTRGKVSK